MLTKTRSFFETQGKGLALLLTMLLGALFPRAHFFSFLIQYLLMVMLFFAYLDIEFKPRRFRKSVIWVLLANTALAFGSYLLLVQFDLTLALSAFMTAIAPTAIAAPVIIGFIHREVEYVVASVLLTNVASAVIVPLALPSLIGAEIQISTWEVLQPGLIVMFTPLILALLVPAFHPGADFHSQRKDIFIPNLAGQPFYHQRQRFELSAHRKFQFCGFSDHHRARLACDLYRQLWPGRVARRPGALAGGQPIARAEESFFRHLDCIDVYKSAGRGGTHVLHRLPSLI
jgi:hypothetical protein